MNLRKTLRRGLLWLLTLTLSQLALAVNGPQYASHGMVVSQNALASEVGTQVLERAATLLMPP